MLQLQTRSRPEGVPPSAPPRSSWLSRLTAALLLIFGFLPVVNWLPGGRAAPWYGVVAGQWVVGSLIAAGGGVVLAILTRQWTPDVRRLSEWGAHQMQAHRRTGACFVILGFLLYAAGARWLFSGVPLHLDEVAQVVQARIFAAGHLYLDPGAHPEFRSALHILDGNGRWFSQFPPGGPLLLVPGVWLGATWLVAPLIGAGCVGLFWGIVRRIEPRAAVALGASAVFAVAPFMAFMSASHMNHAGALLWALLATYALCRLDESPWFAVLTGAALGMLATVRPVDALACAVPIAVWLLWRALRTPAAWRAIAGAGLGIAVPLLGLIWYNWRTTGDPLLFAYEALWGPGHGLGFHAAPWGDTHTPTRGIELISLYLLRLQTYLFETPIPSLSFAIAGLVFAEDTHKIVSYWLYSGLLLLVLYGMFWHDGFYLGPRFVFLLVPVLVLLSVQGLARLAKFFGPASLGARWVWWTIAIAAVMAITINIPQRAGQYARGLIIMRQDPTRPAREGGVHGALILVRESWGAQLVPRLWTLGVSRSLTEAAYRSTDACVLDSAITALERAGARGPSAVQLLLPVLADSARVQPSAWSPDVSERVLPGHPYGLACQRRIAEDRGGFTIFLATLTRDWGDNVYARDLHARDSLLLRQYPDRPLYLLRTAGPQNGAPLLLVPLVRDSLLAEWSAR